MAILTAIFDLGNVLIFFDQQKMILQLANCTGLSKQTIHKILIEEGTRDAYEQGLLTTLDLYQIFKQASPKSFTPEQFFHAASDIFQLNPPMLPILSALQQKNIRLVLLSNTSPVHFDYIAARYPFLDLFDAKILSYEVGASKPHPQIFQAAIQAAKCSPEECFYTDDIAEYIRAARSHRIDAEVFTDAKTLHSQLQQRQLL